MCSLFVHDHPISDGEATDLVRGDDEPQEVCVSGKARNEQNRHAPENVWQTKTPDPFLLPLQVCGHSPWPTPAGALESRVRPAAQKRPTLPMLAPLFRRAFRPL